MMNNNAEMESIDKLLESLTAWKNNWISNHKNLNEKCTSAVQIFMDLKNTAKNNENKVQILKELRLKDADLKHLEEECGYALIPHVFWSKILIQFFVDRGINVNARDEKGDTALHLAIRHGIYEHKMDEVIEFLLEQGADPKIVNLRGENVLFALVLANYRRVVPQFSTVAKMLIASGGGSGAELVAAARINNDGKSLLHLLDLKIIDFNGFNIEDFNVDAKTSTWFYAQTPLMFAARKNRLESCRILIERGAFVNAVDLQGYTALHHAVLNEAHECVQFLVQMGADENVKSSSGRDATDLNVFCQRGSPSPSPDTVTGPMKTILQTKNAMQVIKYVNLRKALSPWTERELPRLHEVLANYECLEQLNLSESTTIEEIIESAMNSVAKLSNNYNKFWNLIFTLSGLDSSFFVIFLNFLSDDFNRVEEFASIEEIDFETLLKLVEFFDYKWFIKEWTLDGERKISHVHSIARLVITCFEKLTRVTKSRKVSDTCIKLYLTLCSVLTSLNFRFKDVIPEENEKLLKKLVNLNLRDGDSNSLMHLVLGGDYSYKFGPGMALFLLDFEVNVQTRNEMGFEPVQTISSNFDYYWRRNVEFRVLIIKMADRGAHIDARNAVCNRATIREVFEKEERPDLSFKYDNLQCACARVVVRSRFPYANRVPKIIAEFIRQHK